MKKKILTLSSFFVLSLSACTTGPTYSNDVGDITSEGKEDANSLPSNADSTEEHGRIDWLTAWWKAAPSLAYRGIEGLGFNRWLATAPQAYESEEEDLNPDEDTINLWDEVGEQVTLADSNHPRVKKEAKFYARNQQFLDYISDRAEPYFNFVLGEVQRRNLPVELALLPAIESAYEPRATSPRRAAGLWQLIPGTARRWGLNLNRHYDGRRDIFASTHAALDYLQKLNDDFDGDWLLAMAAYNCGEFSVARAIRKNIALGRPTDFWSLDLPSETRTFVPRILGLAALIAEPESYGVQLKTMRDRPVVPVKVDYQIDLARVAEIVDIPLKEVKRLNPAYHQSKTISRGGNLLLPVAQAQAFEAHLAALDLRELSPFPTKSDAPTLEIETKSNPELDSELKFQPEPEEKLKSQTEPELTPEPLPSVEAELATNRVISTQSPIRTHVVRRGDTLSGVAQAAGVGIKDIMAWNHLKPRAPLRTGQRLILRMGTDETAPIKVISTQRHVDKNVDKHGRIKAVVLVREKHQSRVVVSHARNQARAGRDNVSHHASAKVGKNKQASRSHNRRS